MGEYFEYQDRGLQYSLDILKKDLDEYSLGNDFQETREAILKIYKTLRKANKDLINVDKYLSLDIDEDDFLALYGYKVERIEGFVDVSKIK